MYSSDNNNLYDDKIQANQILDLIESLGDEKLTAFFKQMDYPEEEKILYLYQQLKITPKYDQNHKILPVSETDQLAAVNKDGYAIGYIIEQGIIPSEDVQLAAVNQYGSIISYIENPSEDVQLAAVNGNGSGNGNAIQYIKYPSERVKQLARDKGSNYV